MSEPSTIAVYGGSFDPPHVGHFLVASWVAGAMGVDEVLIVPTAHHSLGKEAWASHAHRVAMCELLAERVPGTRVSPIEIDLPSPSRTLPLLHAVHASHPDSHLRLVVGADIAVETHRWHRWDEIVKFAPPIWVGRVGYPHPTGALVDFPNVSSTEIRQRLSQGLDVDGLVLDTVRDYIDEHELYRGRIP